MLLLFYYAFDNFWCNRDLNKLYTNILFFSWRSFFRDAVPTLGTAAAMGLMRDLIRNGQATENEADMWITSLAFIPKPTTDMLVEVKVNIHLKLIYLHNEYFKILLIRNFDL